MPDTTRTHFHSGDERFCGTGQTIRRFTLDPNEVTCKACMARDTFVISPSGEELLRQLDARKESQ